MDPLSTANSSIVFKNGSFTAARSTVISGAVTCGLLSAIRHGGIHLHSLRAKEGDTPSWQQTGLKVALIAGVALATLSAFFTTAATSAFAGALSALVCTIFQATAPTVSLVSGISSLIAILCSAVGWGGAIGWATAPFVMDEWNAAPARRPRMRPAYPNPV